MEDLSLWSEDDVRQPPQRTDGADNRYNMRSAFSSKAALLNRKSAQALVSVNGVSSVSMPSVSMTPAMQSALSLNTLGGVSIAGSNTSDDMTTDLNHRLKDYTQTSDYVANRAGPSNWSNPYDFLTDGARAVRAFVRPFPVAVVGLPSDIQFDIKKAEFKLTVRVRPEDRPVPLSPSRASSSTNVNAKEDGNLAEIPTRDFHPFGSFRQGRHRREEFACC